MTRYSCPAIRAAYVSQNNTTPAGNTADTNVASTGTLNIRPFFVPLSRGGLSFCVTYHRNTNTAPARSERTNRGSAADRLSSHGSKGSVVARQARNDEVGRDQKQSLHEQRDPAQHHSDDGDPALSVEGQYAFVELSPVALELLSQFLDGRARALNLVDSPLPSIRERREQAIRRCRKNDEREVIRTHDRGDRGERAGETADKQIHSQAALRHRRAYTFGKYRYDRNAFAAPPPRNTSQKSQNPAPCISDQRKTTHTRLHGSVRTTRTRSQSLSL